MVVFNQPTAPRLRHTISTLFRRQLFLFIYSPHLTVDIEASVSKNRTAIDLTIFFWLTGLVQDFSGWRLLFKFKAHASPHNSCSMFSLFLFSFISNTCQGYSQNSQVEPRVYCSAINIIWITPEQHSFDEVLTGIITSTHLPHPYWYLFFLYFWLKFLGMIAG